MTLYIDTSVLVSTFTREASTARSQLWLSGQDPDSLVISEWVMTEFSAALFSRPICKASLGCD